MQQKPKKQTPKPEKGQTVRVDVDSTLAIQGKVVETVGNWVLVEFGPRDIMHWPNGKPAGLG